MPIVTLTTDLGSDQFQIAKIRAQILSENFDLQLIEITHNVDHFNVAEAAYVLENTYRDFPKGSIHIVGVDALPHQSFIVAWFEGYYFICADNGLLSLLTKNKEPEKIIRINKSDFQEHLIFPTAQVFLPIAIALAKGIILEQLGTVISDFERGYALQPVEKADQLIGNIIYIDHFENVVSNIHRDKFFEVAKGRDFEVLVRGQAFKEIHYSYSGIVKKPERETQYHGRGMVLFNSANYLEIAIYKSKPKSFGSAKRLFGLSHGDPVIVEFMNT